ncbi:DUF4276 family protein [Burkholderia arboris]|uniref:DUF4276 family protein n=1 Tax=Burkholderia arboris TaxID=488730 RepID=UPI001CF408E5|nr:DUF4276 family protein [Burkholderia arboris]MCA8048052.1 DUF4276 family protein [Burkholderia arboris]
MNRKIALFVEGLTEQEFVVNLLKEMAGKRGVTFELQRQYRGLLEFVDMRAHGSPEFHCLVVNCQNDGQVKSQIKDQYGKLKEAGYCLVIGLRDVYPLAATDIPRLSANLYKGLAIDELPVAIHLAILEVEAWFIEEHTHFTRVDPKLNTDTLVAQGFEPGVTLASDLANPADTLDRIYQVAGKRYAKKARQIQRTIEALSYEELYLNVRGRASSLHDFLRSIEVAMFPPVKQAAA